MRLKSALGRAVTRAAVALVITAGSLVVLSNTASAAPTLQMPFPCGTEWRLNTYDSTHAPALDIVHEPQGDTEGQLVVAPADGTVVQSFYHQNAGNMIQIDHGSRTFTTYIHLQSRAVSAGDQVKRGDPIARVGHTGPTSNGVPHLHYEQGYDADGNGTASWGFEGAERVAARFDNVAYGPGTGGEWRNVVSKNCDPLPSSASFSGDARSDLMVLETNGNLSARINTGTYYDGGRVVSAQWSNFLGNPGQGKLYFSDFNGDGRDDLMVLETNGNLSARINTGTYYDGGRVVSAQWSNFLGNPGQGKLYFA